MGKIFSDFTMDGFDLRLYMTLFEVTFEQALGHVVARSRGSGLEGRP